MFPPGHRRTRYGFAVSVIAIVAVTAAALPDWRAAEDIAGLRASKAGVDERNNLWTWDASANVVRRVTPAGDVESKIVIPPAVSVDADAKHGIVALLVPGNHVQVIDWQGEVVSSFSVKDRAGDIAWMRDGNVAITPHSKRHRLEIWSTLGSSLVSTAWAWDADSEDQDAIAHTTLVRFDHWNDELIALDAKRGTIAVFNADGTLMREAALRAPRSPYAGMSVDGRGAIWVRDEDEGAGGVRVAQLQRDATIRYARVAVPQCASATFQVWDAAVMFYRDPRTPAAGPPCTWLWRGTSRVST